MSKAERIFQLAQEGADAYHMFKARRTGAGTPYVNEVINHLKFLVVQEFGTGTANQFLSKENRQSVDFWLEDEQTIIEMEFNILSSPSVLEKEVFQGVAGQRCRKRRAASHSDRRSRFRATSSSAHPDVGHKVGGAATSNSGADLGTERQGQPLSR
ncbi:MAG: hypothetical protein ACLQU3_09315 [Limisphaerales bacterium]